MIIDGAPVTSESFREILDPGTAQVIAEVPEGSVADVDQAVTAARKSFDTGRWHLQPPEARARVLWRIADMLEERADGIAHLEALNQGAPYNAVRDGFVMEAARVFRYYAGWADKISGRALQLQRRSTNFHAYTQRSPIGVVGLITPWNSPLGMASWKAAPALAVGVVASLNPQRSPR